MMSFSLRQFFCICVMSLLPVPVFAAGFYLQEQGITGLGRSYAGSAASADDASTIYFNPAGMARLPGREMVAGLHFLYPEAKFSNTGSTYAGGSSGNPYGLSVLPTVHIAAPVWHDKLWLGIGVGVPFGLGSEYKENWFGRFDSTENELSTWYVQPSLAWRFNEVFSVGMGVEIQSADAKLENDFLPAPAGSTSTLEGDDYSLGFVIGVHIQPLPELKIGLSYRSGISHELDGAVTIAGVSPLADGVLPGTVDLDLPAIASLGAVYDINADWRLYGQVNWFQWSNFEEIRVVFDDTTRPDSVTTQNYEDTIAVSLGVEYDLNPQWILRAGMQYDETPTVDEYRTSRTPDGDRLWLSVGASYQLNDKILLDVGYVHIEVSEEDIDLVRAGGNFRAQTEGRVDILSLGVRYRF